MSSTEIVSERLNEVVRLVRTQTQLIGVALLAATFVVPLAAARPQDPGGDVPVIDRWGIAGLIGHLESFTAQVHDHLAEPYPYSAPGGLLLMKVGLVLLVIGALTTAGSALIMIDDRSTRAVWFARIAIGVLVLGTVLLAIGLVWFPEYGASNSTEDGWGDIDVGPSWGLWMPFLAAAWTGLGRRGLVELSRW